MKQTTYYYQKTKNMFRFNKLKMGFIQNRGSRLQISDFNKAIQYQSYDSIYYPGKL